ncbi:Aspartic peptidase domain superfamily [Sesbania bispinosa]|nr:Aspartic peptidase domain superfamily [Sesbania bispinosa]
MTERAKRMTPRRLSFNLEDFPETGEGRIGLNNPMGTGHAYDRQPGIHFGTPTFNTTREHEELNLLSGFETPRLMTTRNEAHPAIPMDVLNNLLASQQSLVNLVMDLKTLSKEGEIFLSLGGISTFAELIKKGTDVAEAMKRQSKERKRSFRNNPQMRRFLPQDVEDLPPLPISRQQAFQLVEEWLKDGTIQPKVNRPPLPREQYDDPSFCILHRTRAHTTTDCWTVRRTFHRQVKVGKVLLPEKEKAEEDLHRRPLPNHGVSAVTLSHQGMRIKEIREDEDDEDNALTLGLAKTRSFRILFSQLGLNHDAQREAAKALMGIVKNHGGEVSAVNAPLTRLARSHATAIVFREPTFQGEGFCHNKPLYVEATVEGLRLRRALVDNGSGVNILPTYILRKMNVPRSRLRVSDITLSTFHGEPVESMGCVNVVLELGPIKTVNTFHIVERDPSYHLLLSRPWIHLHQCVPSTLHQCIKSNFKGKDIEI